MSGLMAKGPPPTPGFYIFLKIALGVLSFAVFVASCFNVAQLGGYVGVGYYGAGGGGLGIWTCIFTWFYLGIEIFLGMSMHNLYMRIVFVFWLGLLFIFWLSTWANAASGATILSTCFEFDFCKKYGGSLAAVAAIGAFCWLIVIALLVFYVLACMRDPAASNNYQPNNFAQPNAELGAVKNDGTQQPQPGYGQPQYGQPQPAPYQS